ncbi:MAG: glycine cleavage T C-terminal barrel domain-containing protein, partial [Betaproteobacteria bacterium]
VARAGTSPNHPYPIFDHPRGKNFVDFDEDLQLKDFINAAQEGFDNIELLKRYTTVGMGPSQGKHSNMNAIRILAKLLHQTPGEVGSATARPFFHPVPMSHLAGRGFHPDRRTPLHSRHEAAGAVFMQAGVWLRPEYYAVQGKQKRDAVRDEASAVRSGVGLIDVGTLGKMEITGPDAAAFLERLYTGRFGNMKVGMTRYALMLDESAVVIDDGVVARLGEEQFYFTTTTTGSANVYREMTRLNLLWQMNVGIVNATGGYAAMNLAGPRSREVLAEVTKLDLSPQAFPYLAVREGDVAGASARIMRVGFVGELGYEIHVPADCAALLWDALMHAGRGHGIRLFGVEAQRLLRLEKGHIIIGQDTDGLTTPVEAAMGWAVKMDKPYFIGQRSLKIIERKQAKARLIGFMLETDDENAAPRECHLVIRDGQIAGRVTSIAFSPVLGRHIGLAFVPPDMAAEGTLFFVRADAGRMIQARVVPTPFYDPAGALQKAAP